MKIIEEHNEKRKYVLVTHAAFAIYSMTGILTKLAAMEEKMSLRFFVCYGGAFCLMGFYAIIWQQIIKRQPLAAAYINKAVVVVWGMVWGVLFFHEQITFGKVAGIVLVVIGIILYGKSGTGETYGS